MLKRVSLAVSSSLLLVLSVSALPAIASSEKAPTLYEINSLGTILDRILTSLCYIILSILYAYSGAEFLLSGVYLLKDIFSNPTNNSADFIVCAFPLVMILLGINSLLISLCSFLLAIKILLGGHPSTYGESSI